MAEIKKINTDLQLEGRLLDGNGSAGTSGQVLSSTGTATDWVSLSEISGVDGSGTSGQIAYWSDSDTITGSSDADTNVNIGRLKLGSYVTDYMYLSHYDFGTAANYALKQAPTGNTSLNAPTGQTVGLSINNTSHLLVNSSGNVGIGTTNPGTKLHVRTSSSGATRYSSLNGIDIEGTGVTGINILSPDNGYGRIYFGSPSSNTAGSIEYVHSSTVGDGYLILRAGASSTMYIKGGNVGIGTTSPAEKLDILGNVKIKGNADFYNTSNQLYGRVYSDSEGLSFNTVANRHTRFLKQGVETMRIDTSGNVGIGTTSPSEKLEVDGNIKINRTSGTARLTIGTTNSFGRDFYLENNGLTQQIVAENTLTIKTLNNDTQIVLDGGSNADNIQFVTDENERMRLTNDGLGIGLTTPQARLHVSGSGNVLTVEGSGSTLFDIQGSQGQLFSVTDDLTGTLFAVSDISGIPVFSVDATGESLFDGDLGVSGSLTVSGSGNHYVVGGNVGIGTTAPDNTLHIVGPDISGASLKWQNTSRIPGYLYSDGGGAGIYVNTLEKTGIYFFDSSRIDFRVNSSERMRIDSSGNVGIGTTNPGYKLHVAGDASVSTWLYVSNIYPTSSTNDLLLNTGAGRTITLNPTSTGKTIIPAGNVGIGTTSPSQKLEVAGNTLINNSGDGKLYLGSTSDYIGNIGSDIYMYSSGQNIFYAGGSEQMRIKTNGNVGIGTTSPGAKLHIDIVTEDNQPALKITKVSDAGENAMEVYHGTSSSARGIADFTNANGSVMFIRGDGSVGIGTTSPSATLELNSSTANAAKLRVGRLIGLSNYLELGTSGGESVINSIGTASVNGSIIFNRSTTTVTSESMRIDSSGNVGIGTTSPGAKLEVQTVDANRYIRFKAPNGEERFEFYTGGTGNPAAQHMYDADGTTRNVQIAAGGTSYFNGGNVGIGTNSPSRKLTIGGITNTGDGLKIEDPTNTDYGAHLTYYDAGSEVWLGGITNNVYNQTLSIHRDATRTITVDINNNVGIGTTSPSQRAVISGPNTSPSLNTTAVSNASLLISNSDTGYGTYFASTGGGIGLIQQRRQTSAVYYDLALQPYGGNVGIGTTSPGYKLEVSGNTALSLGADRYLRIGSSTNYWWDLQSVSNDFTLKEAGSNIRLIVKAGGNVGIGTTSPGQKLDVQGTVLVNNEIQFVDSSMRIFRSSNDMRIRTGGSDKVTINSSGNVGIGTTSPAYKLTSYENTAAGAIVASFGNPINVNAYTAIGLSGFTASNGANKAGIALKRTGNYGTGELHFLNNNTSDNSDVTLSDSKMMIDSSGNVGIGTTSPLYKLDVIGSARIDGILRVGTTAQSGRLHIIDSNGKTFSLNSGIVSNNNFSIREEGTSTDMLVIEGATGNVGIGTTSPQELLHLFKQNHSNPLLIEVENDGYLAGTSAGIKLTSKGIDGSSGSWTIDNLNRDTLRFLDDGSEKMRITSTGNVGIGTTSPGAKLHIKINDSGATPISQQHLILENNSATGLGILTTSSTSGYIFFGDENDAQRGYISYTHPTDHMAFKTNGAERVRIASSGNVGIGTTSPSSTLNVVGGDIRTDAIDDYRYDTDTNFVTGVGSDPSYMFNGPFTTITHDVFRFLGNQFGSSYLYNDVTQSIYDGSTWTTEALDSQIFSGNTSVTTGVINDAAGEQAVRWEVNNVAYNSARWLVINHTYVAGGVSKEVKVETSGSSGWTTRHISTYSGAALPYLHHIENYGGDSRIRITITKGDLNDGKNINVSSIQLLTTRHGDQGKGAQEEHAYIWDKERNIGVGNYAPGAGTLEARLAVKGTTADTSAYATVMRNSSNTGLFSVRNDGRVDIPAGSLITGQDVTVGSRLNITTVDNASSDTDKFLVLNGTEVEYRTGTQLLSDIGAAAASHTHDDRYYTETEIGNFFSGATAITGYSKTNWDSAYTYSQVGHLPLAGGTLTGALIGTSGAFTGTLTIGDTAGATINMLRSSANYINATNATGYLIFRTGGYNTALTLNLAQNATFAGTVGVQGAGNSYFQGNVGIGTTSPSEKLDVVGNGTITGDLTVGGKVTAQEFHTEFVSASVIYQSGSTQFGNSIDDTHIFTGSVNIDGTLTATKKSFKIDHPTQPGKTLVYGVLEGPEHAVYVRGESQEDTVILPEEWTGLVDESTITAQLTSIGSPDVYYYKGYEDNSIKVGGPQSMHYFYYIQATRKDVEPLITVQ